jgi:hypothetical protein
LNTGQTLERREEKWARVPMHRQFECSRCQARLDGFEVAVDHFYFLHRIPRDVVRAAIASGANQEMTV